MFKREKSAGKNLRKNAVREFVRLCREEDGTMIIFGLVMLIIMLAAGGMAVDFMRFERDRAITQYTLDRAMLASAALSQPLDPQTVVEDYFDKSGIEDVTLVVTPDAGINYKKVTASAQKPTKTFFINMLGIDTMTASTAGAAEERIEKVEISLVLDVSGSMGNNSKLQNLKDAAKEFVDTVLTTETQDLISISVIPYNMQVNAGSQILNGLPITTEHTNSNCVDFDADDYEETSMRVSDGSIIVEDYQRSGHFDAFYTTINHPDAASTLDDTRVWHCPTTEWSRILLHSQDNQELKDKIDSFVAGGNTSIDIGVKWGTAFLDPSTRPITAAQTGDDNVDGVFDNRPANYDDGETIKILVVMTDGINTTEYRLQDDYRSGLSDLWMDQDSTWISIQTEGITTPGTSDDVFYASDLYTWDLDGNGWEDDAWVTSPYDANPGNGDDPINLTWPEVFEMMSVRYDAYYHNYAQYWSASDYYDRRNAMMNWLNGSQKNARLDDACTAAKGENIVVFTIGFEVSNASGQVLKDCASSASNYYDVDGVEISDAFNSIAKTIQRLKLIQ